MKKNYYHDGQISFGNIIEELDAMAGDCSYKYLLKDDNPEAFDPAVRPFYLVTVSVDRVDFMSKIDPEKDLKLSAYMLFAKGSSLMVKIDCLQRAKGEEKWEQIGDAIIIFVARDRVTNKAYKIPDMHVSEYDDVMLNKRCMEIGLTIKDWSRDKSKRDMHTIMPSFEEMNGLNKYLEKVESLRKTCPEKVVRASNTIIYHTLLMQY